MLKIFPFKSLAILSLAALSISVPSITFAHSGGLNAQGCHAGSKPYHCHRSQKLVQKPSSSAISKILGDHNCADFRNWSEAQAFYEDSGQGDPHRLDADNDGIACEGLR